MFFPGQDLKHGLHQLLLWRWLGRGNTIAAAMRETRRHKRKTGEEKHKGNQCNATGDPPAFRHGHFHFYHANPSLITLPGNGGDWERLKDGVKTDTERRGLQRLSKSVCAGYSKDIGHRNVKEGETEEIRVLGSKHVLQPERGTSSSDQLPSLLQWLPHAPKTLPDGPWEDEKMSMSLSRRRSVTVEKIPKGMERCQRLRARGEIRELKFHL